MGEHMPHTYSSILIHFVFSTFKRKRMIKKRFEKRLYSYISGIANHNNSKVIAINSTEDHIHMLLSIHCNTNISRIVQLIKGKSSHWINDNFYNNKIFQWQAGYGAFSIGHKEKNSVVKYIHNQKNHHKKITFEDEYILLLEMHNIKYDLKYLFG